MSAFIYSQAGRFKLREPNENLILSNNESFKKKLRSYANTLYWNETLREDSYKSKLDFKDLINRFNLDFRAMESFGPKELEERHRLLFDICKIIWE